jgi:hypothetical protein
MTAPCGIFKSEIGENDDVSMMYLVKIDYKKTSGINTSQRHVIESIGFLATTATAHL